MKPNFWIVIYQVLYFWHLQGYWTQTSGTSLAQLWLLRGVGILYRRSECKASQVKQIGATIYNAYRYMVIVVETSMNLNQDIISAHYSFKIAETIEDCEFPSYGTIDFVYMGGGYSGWVGQSEFCKGWKWLLPRSRGGRHPNLIIVYASEAHTGTWLVHKTSTFELDFKLV